jgi:hypothetical protein
VRAAERMTTGSWAMVLLPEAAESIKLQSSYDAAQKMQRRPP